MDLFGNKDHSGVNDAKLGKLPYWAQIAVAARVMRRVLPLSHWKIHFTEKIVAFAEQSARTGKVDLDVYAQLTEEDHKSSRFGGLHLSGCRIERAAGEMISAVYRLGHAISRSESAQETMSTDAHNVIELAFLGGRLTGCAESMEAVDDANIDIDFLFEYSIKHALGKFAPVDPNICGPVWSKPEPDWYLNAVHAAKGTTREPGRLEVALNIPPLADTVENRQVLLQHLKEVLSSINGMHISHGGSGLKIDDVQLWLPRTSPAKSVGGDK